jgi:hypothetical protein
MSETITQKLISILESKSKAELLILGKALKVNNYSTLSKKELISELLNNHEKDLKKKLLPTFWDKYKDHIYGAITIIGFFITIYTLFPNTGSSDNFSTSLLDSPLSQEVRQKRIAVMPFKNRAFNDSITTVGVMAMDWISQGLLEHGNARVIKEDADVIIDGLKANSNYVPQGAEILIRGSYYEQGTDSIVVTTDIFDAITREIIYAPSPFKGNKNEPLKLIEAIQQQILGYWVYKDAYLGNKPPRYDAYEAYAKSLAIDRSDWKQRELLTKKAMALDPEFYLPGNKLLWIAVNTAQPEVAKYAIDWLEAREANFSDYERLVFESARARAEGDFSKGAAAAWKLFEKYKLLPDGEDALYYNNSANNLSKVRELFKLAVEQEQFDFKEIKEQEGFMAFELNAILKTQAPDSVLKKISEIKNPIKSAHIVFSQIRAYTKLNQIEKADSLIHYYKDKKIEFFGHFTPTWLTSVLCSDLYIFNHPKLDAYIDVFESWNEELSDHVFYLLNKSMIAYLRGNPLKAYDYAQEYYKTDVGKGLYSHVSAICLLKLNKPKEAQAWMDTIIAAGDYYPGQIDYGLGFYYGHLGDTEKMVFHLKQANVKGFDYDWYNYRDDFFAKELFKYPEFKELTEPK